MPRNRRAAGKTLSAVVQDALRAARAARLNGELRGIQGFWSRQAKEKGVLTEKAEFHSRPKRHALPSVIGSPNWARA